MQAQSRPAGLLRTHVLLIVAITLLTINGALAVALLQPAQYVSESRVVMQPERVRGGGTPLAPDMGTEREIAVSGTVAREASDELDLSAETASANLQVEVPVDTNVLEFSYSASTGERAFLGAQVFTQAYVDYRNGLDSSVAQIITPPSVPSEPTRPNLYLVLAVSLLAGLGLGIAIAYVWDRLSPRLRDLADVESHTGLAVLASIPTLRVRRGERMVVGSQQALKGTEAYGHLAVKLLSLLQQNEAHSVLITSPAAGAGKTTVTLNLAASLTAAGQDVVVLSADARDELQIWSGVARRPGLHELLRGKVPLADALHDTEIDGLRILPPGGSMMVPRTALNLRRMSVLLDELREAADVVLVEAPSVLGGAHSALLAEQVDLTVLVVDLRRGRRADAAAAVQALSPVESRLSGCVVNDPGRRPQSPEGPPPSPIFRLVVFNRRGRSKSRGSSSEGNQHVQSSIRSKDVEAVPRLRDGGGTADADAPGGAGGGTDRRVIDLQ
jgi:Mrp family chromosome partitioning ATPase